MVFNNGWKFQYVNGVHIQAEDGWESGFYQWPITYTNYNVTFLYPNSSILTNFIEYNVTGVKFKCWEREPGGWASTDWAIMFSMGI